MADAKAVYESLKKQMREAALLGSAETVLGWDERTHMPAKGGAHRAEQLGLLARLTHEQFTDKRIGDALDSLRSSELMQPADSDAATNVREWKRQYDRKVKLPPALVQEMSRTEVLSQQAWVEARKKSSFAEFQPWLEKVVKLTRQKAECYGYEGSI